MYGVLIIQHLMVINSTVCVWDVDNNKQIQFNGHSNEVYYVKFSSYHYHNHRQNVICSSSRDKTIRFWDFKHNKQLQIFNGHTWGVYGIEFSSFNGGRYLCSGSYDNTICYVMLKHQNYYINNNNGNNNKMNNIGVIGGNGYTICSGSIDKTIRIWDIETTKQFIVFKGHEKIVRSVKYGSNELLNTIFSGSEDNSIRLWDIRFGQQIRVFNGHTEKVFAVEYSPFIINNSGGIFGWFGSNSNVMCSGSWDNTIRFWDIRSNRNELYMIKGDEKEDKGICCLKFIVLKNKDKTKNVTYDSNLCYGSCKGFIHIWG
ncbi:hypothetical protein RFI_07646 [Reticulomyxa filosa]|uniref:Uncharacterized protein n=1 Tax=Reticulomyxa filosa TaxID=46433 RepID=X6NUL5_RETFI|nr:hypothetical protein RFI_07646 [Reticulomyxa filosa]|eukprot:ETO29474.1 hypothetical protein RFI_07646 [Reticulomyxa filosa]